MNSDDLLASLRARPFRPFRLVTTEGTRYEIRHPEWLMPARRHVVIGVHNQPEDAVADHAVYVALLHIQRIEPLDAPSVKANGPA
jgi:hypothetical protein